VGLDSDFYYLIQSYAQRSGLRVESVSHNEEFVASIHHSQPVLIILELDRMDDELVWNMLRMIKGDPIVHQIPVLLFSWLDEEETALDRGVDIFIRKPIMYADFVRVLVSVGICQKPQHMNQFNEERR